MCGAELTVKWKRKSAGWKARSSGPVEHRFSEIKHMTIQKAKHMQAHSLSREHPCLSPGLPLFSRADLGLSANILISLECPGKFFNEFMINQK